MQWYKSVNRGTQGLTGLYKGLQEYTDVYKGLQGYIRVCSSIKGFTGVYKGTRAYSYIFALKALSFNNQDGGPVNAPAVSKHV